jgi:hypothetical protein
LVEGSCCSMSERSVLLRTVKPAALGKAAGAAGAGVGWALAIAANPTKAVISKKPWRKISREWRRGWGWRMGWWLQPVKYLPNEARPE